MCLNCRFGIFPSWGLSQKLSRIIGPNKSREVSLSCIPLTAEQAENLGFVNYVVEGSELMKKAQEIAVSIAKNNQDLVLRYKSVIKDGLKLNLGDALALEKVINLFELVFFFFGDFIFIFIVWLRSEGNLSRESLVHC